LLQASRSASHHTRLSTSFKEEPELAYSPPHPLHPHHCVTALFESLGPWLTRIPVTFYPSMFLWFHFLFFYTVPSLMSPPWGKHRMLRRRSFLLVFALFSQKPYASTSSPNRVHLSPALRRCLPACARLLDFLCPPYCALDCNSQVL